MQHGIASTALTTNIISPESLNDYFSQFGEVAESTVMRESSGRSRGFGFLTFRDPQVVDTVMVKEHFLDGKIVRPSSCLLDPSKQEPQISLSRTRWNRSRSLRLSQIDPKRAIPRDEQEKTAKIFVGGVSQEASETDFTSFFAQFGRVIDATLMMDKDTGRPRGFGFVTFDNEAAVDRCLAYHPLEILGKPIEVKKAQPRGKMGEEEDTRGGRGRGKYGREDRYAADNNQSNQTQNSASQGMMGAGGMTPQMMAQYWQRMQQYFAMMQQQMAATAMGGGMGMNPQMMAQMQQMQQMQNMQKQMGGQSPNPQMQQQMMQMMQQQQQQNGGGAGGMSGVPTGPSSNNTRSVFSAQEQQAFEQRKYEQQHAKASRGNSNTPIPQQQSGQAPQSWEGMYDDVPQPNEGGRTSASGARTPQGGGPPGKAPKGPSNVPQPSGNAPLNAPTGPKNPGKQGGGGGGGGFRGGRGRYHPYGR